MALYEVFNMVYNYLSSTVLSIHLGSNVINISMLNLMLGGALFFIIFKFIFKVLK